MTEPQKQRATKETVASWFDAAQAANRERRGARVSVDDVRERIAARKAERTARDRSSRVKGAIPAAIGVGLLVCAGVLGASAFSSTKVFEAETVVLAHQIETAKGELASIPTSDEQGVEAYSAVVQEQLAVATEAGEEMVRLQQEYATILFDGNATAQDDMVSEQALQAVIAHQEALGALIRVQSIPSDEAALDDDTLDPRRPWYVGFENDGITVVDPTNTTWSLVSVMATGPGVFELAWLNRGTSGELKAWATASYYSEDAKFGAFTVGKTTHGVDGVTQVETGRK